MTQIIPGCSKGKKSPIAGAQKKTFQAAQDILGPGKNSHELNQKRNEKKQEKEQEKELGKSTRKRTP
jgi:hypothetical protein